MFRLDAEQDIGPARAAAQVVGRQTGAANSVPGRATVRNRTGQPASGAVGSLRQAAMDCAGRIGDGRGERAQQRGTGVCRGRVTEQHGGVPGLASAVYNKVPTTTILLDNGTTGMTGRQDHPGTGYALDGETAPQVDLEAICRALGVKHVVTIDPFQVDHTRAVIKDAMERPEVSVVITRRPCVLIKHDVVKTAAPLYVDRDKCVACKACLSIGCPAIEWEPGQDGEKGNCRIDRLLCNGCRVCMQLCKFDAFGVCDE